MRGKSLVRFLSWDFNSESLVQLESALLAINKKYQRMERIEAFVDCCDQHMRPLYAEKFGCDASDLISAGTATIEVLTADAFIFYLADFIDDTHRETIVRCHARGQSTTQAVHQLIEVDAVMSYLANRIDVHRLVADLVHRLAYLKPTSDRFPQKYIPIWNEEREKMKEGLRNTDLPLTSIEEWIALLSREALNLKERLEAGPYDEKTHQTLMETLMKVYDRLYPDASFARRVSTQADDMTDKTEMILVLERLIFALKSPKQNNVESVLEVLAEQNQKAIGVSEDEEP